MIQARQFNNISSGEPLDSLNKWLATKPDLTLRTVEIIFDYDEGNLTVFYETDEPEVATKD